MEDSYIKFMCQLDTQKLFALNGQLESFAKRQLEMIKDVATKSKSSFFVYPM